jgi:hypothetical protein
MRSSRLSAALLVLGFVTSGFGATVACSPSSDGIADPGSSIDHLAPDADEGEEPDAGGGAVDGGASDSASSRDGAAAGDDILGTLVSGACGLVKNELAATAPSLENNLLVFVAGEKYERASLSPGGQTLFDTPNAGGSSAESEVMSYEVLRYCEGAKFLKTETEISYQAPDDAGTNAITDLLVEIGGKKVGVSVTRAYKPPTQPAMTDDEIKKLLVKKLDGINNSTRRVLPEDKWVKQILHVFSVSQALTDGITRVWKTLDAKLRSDTIVLVTQTTGGGFVYCHPVPPLGTECQ